MARKKNNDGFPDFPEEVKLPKLSTTAMNLESNQTQLNFFAAAESLEPGESCLYTPSVGGTESKKRCQGMKAWITWERKRRIKVMSLGSEAVGGLAGVDPLAGTSMYLDKDDAGTTYRLKIIKPIEEQILVFKNDGTVLASIPEESK